MINQDKKNFERHRRSNTGKNLLKEVTGDIPLEIMKNKKNLARTFRKYPVEIQRKMQKKANENFMKFMKK